MLVLRMGRLEDLVLQRQGIDLRRRIRGELWLGGLLNGWCTEKGHGKGANGLLRGQYSDAVLNELESQNDGQVEGIMGKVRQLKDVCDPVLCLNGSADGKQMTIAIGDEIRDSSALAEKMNDSFDSTRVRLRGTMNRMLLMAERTGVGWKVWLAFFAAVGFLFFYVWLF